MKKDFEKILLVGCPEKKEAELISLATSQNKAPMFVKSINVAIGMVDQCIRSNEKFEKVITVSHVWEKDGENEWPRLGSELAKKCSEAGIPCIVFANVTGGVSIVKDFLDAAKRAGATKVLKRASWEDAITCNC